MKLAGAVFLSVCMAQVAWAENSSIKFTCSAHTYGEAGHENDIGLKTFEAPIQEFQGKYAKTSQVLNLGDGFEIVVDVAWRDSTLGNDDVSLIPDQQLQLESRLQYTNGDGNILVLDWESLAVGRVDKNYWPVVKKIYVTNQLKDLRKISEVVKANGNSISNFDIPYKTDRETKGRVNYDVTCSIDL